MECAVLCDFDGTVVEIDTAEYVLEKMAQGDWKTLDEMLDRGEISLEECMEKQFEMVKASRKRIIEVLDSAVRARPGFKDLVEYCRSRSIPFTIASAGLDFYIKHFLAKEGLKDRIDVVVPRVRVTKGGVKFEFPKLRYAASVSFKDDLVRHKKASGKVVAYIGDGTTDFNAARISDLPFAVAESKLDGLLNRNRIPHKEITDFREVIVTLRHLE